MHDELLVVVFGIPLETSEDGLVQLVIGLQKRLAIAVDMDKAE